MKRTLVMSMGLFLLALLRSSLGLPPRASPAPRRRPSRAPRPSPPPPGCWARKTSNVAHVVVVAVAGGDFTSIQAALNSITDASATNAYVVKVAPGSYRE